MVFFAHTAGNAGNLDPIGLKRRHVFGQTSLVEVAEHQIGAAFGKQPRGRPSKSTCTAGDQHRLPVKNLLAHVPSYLSISCFAAWASRGMAKDISFARFGLEALPSRARL